MKRFFIYLALMGAVATSCSKEESDDDGSGPAGCVKEISFSEDGEDSSFKFTYDSQGRVTTFKFVECGDVDYDVTYSYDGDKITISNAGYDETYVVTLNDDDTINNIVWDGETDSDGNDYECTYVYYDGVLASTSQGADFGWSDGNLTNDDGYKFEYGSDLNNLSVDINAYFACVGDGTLGDCYVLAPLKSVVKGCWSKNLVSSYGDGDDAENFTYKFSGDRLTEITLESSEGEVAYVTYY